jgi:hypothetical protein
MTEVPVITSDDLTNNSTDATKWAKAFCAYFAIAKKQGIRSTAGMLEIASILDDAEGLMLGWFANAIETGRTAGQKEKDPLEKDLEDALKVIMLLVQRVGGDAVITEADLQFEKGRLVRYENENSLGGFTLHYDGGDVGPVLDFRWYEDEEEEDDDDCGSDDYYDTNGYP